MNWTYADVQELPTDVYAILLEELAAAERAEAPEPEEV